MSAGALGGNEALAERRPGQRDKVVKAMDELDAELKAAQAAEKTMGMWTSVRKSWASLEQMVASKQIKSAESIKLHTQLIEDMLVVNEELVSEFGLALDPAEDTYFLIQSSMVHMPLLGENLGILRAQGTGFLNAGALPPEGRATLSGLVKRVQEVRGDMFRNLDRAMTANRDLKADIGTPGEASRALVDIDPG